MSNRKKVFLVGFNVLIEEQDEEQKTGGIIIPDEAKKNADLKMGIVRQTGPGFMIPTTVQNESYNDMAAIIEGKNQSEIAMSFIPLDIKEGDTAYFAKEAGSEIILDGKRFVVVPYPAIKCFIRNLEI